MQLDEVYGDCCTIELSAAIVYVAIVSRWSKTRKEVLNVFASQLIESTGAACLFLVKHTPPSQSCVN